MTRNLLPWEMNHLRKYGFTPDQMAELDETPVEYLTGHALFRGLDFHVTKDCLIPRLETEKIVDIALNLLEHKPHPSPLVIADVGCGSGALGLSLIHELERLKKTDYQLILSDISPQALEIARLNLDQLLPQSHKKVVFIESDLLDNYPSGTRIDCLLSNLPYIPSSRIPTLDRSVIDYEPLTALDGGPDGTRLINQLLHQSPRFLSPQSFLILEIDHSHTLKHFHTPPGLTAKIKRDDFGKNRYLIIDS